MTKSKLTDKQRLFVAEYLTDFNGAAAYRRAGYTARGNSAEVNASRLLRKAQVQEAIRERVGELIERTEITQERVVEEYRRLALSDMRDFLRWDGGGVTWLDSDELADGAAACVSEVSETISEGGRTRRFKLHSKTHALDQLAKYVKLFGDDEKPGYPREGVNVNVNIDNRPKAKPLSDFTDEELEFYGNLLADNEAVPNH